MSRQFNQQPNPTAWAFALPALLGLLCFVLLPFVLAMVLSFSNLRLGSPLATEFVGFTQYQRIITDTAFLHALKNNTLFGIYPLVVCRIFSSVISSLSF